MANWQRGMMRLLRIANHPAEVIAVDDLTPWYRRILFRSPEVVAAVDPFPTLWLRLWAPDPRRGEGAVAQRGYTFVSLDAAGQTFELDFVLHDVAGPAGDWARRARIGERVEVALTPARIEIPDGTDTLLLAGDVTALPAINTWLESVPAGISTHVLVEDDHADRDALPQTPRPRGTWQWVTREGDRGAALARAVLSVASAGDGLYAWGAGEKTLVKNLRGAFRDHLRLDRAHHFTQFYWIEGKATG
ncbi:siderophore-interacting protein [Microbacterium marinilacus]|uniref:Siderophore-interacting protein n=1 Tax=Microbacterium marinilacus TaxID=415209 RepID=A0ABP7B3E7_9MICO|nr:siderophore-interacting protein [Microbacterium marinilacus]MBY0687892.1 siderophore-interacting protein [Microbacterium marinilacus]